ncbi:MAG: CehA/McbA family metallohydrolase [Thermoguttaceae bacterium]|nr:CehA/McbA family metallohydrolase [Thermoguttaceae bacterium]
MTMWRRRREFLTALFSFWVGVGLSLLGELAVKASQADELQLVVNPYEGIDWEKVYRVKTGLHAHTTESDGSEPPERMIDEYRRLGFQALALTDHNKCTWPWEKWGRSANDLGMLAIPGNELSRHHHTVSLFTTYESELSDLNKNLENINNLGGLAILAHPGRYWKPTAAGVVPADVLERYKSLFMAHDVLIGIEVINYENRYPHDRLLWDALLEQVMPGRPVWGVANDDAHSRSAVGRNWVVLLMTELSLSAAKEALRQGRFYFATITTHDRLVRNREQTPEIIAVLHHPQEAVLEIKAVSGGKPLPEEACVWISAGKVVHKGMRLHYNRTPGLRSYVRAELKGQGGTAFTQPFGFAVKAPNQ